MKNNLLMFKTNISFVHHNLYGMVCFHLALVTQFLGYYYDYDDDEEDDDDLFLNMTHGVSICSLYNASSFLIVTMCSLIFACFSIVISKLCIFSCWLEDLFN